MVERDYVLRMIEQAGTVLKRLLRLVRDQGADREQLTDDLQQAAQLGGLDLDILRICDVEGLRHLVTLTGELDPARTWLGAETLYLDAVAADLEGDGPAAIVSYVKAASLYRMMEPTWVLPTGFPEASERIAEIDARLAKLSAE
jgi:hypothetical protein